MSYVANPVVVSLAILKVNWDVEGQKSYLDNFVPIIAECIRISSSNVVSAPEICSILQSHFGFTIPLNLIELLLTRVKKRGYIKLEHGTYKPIRSRLDKSPFRDIQQSVLKMHDALVTHIKTYAYEYHDVHWSDKQAEDALLQFLAENDLVTMFDWPLTATQRNKHNSTGFIIGRFIQHLQETYSHALEYLETVVKGNMLANALFLTTPGKEQKKFRKTQLYFDAPFILFLLGYAGKERQSPCQELMSLLENSEAELRCFRHTLDEARGILEGIGHGLERGNAYGPSLDYFLSQKMSPSDVLLLAGRLEKDIQKQGIKIVDKPPYDEDKYPYVISEEDLKKELQENINYRYEIAIDRDVDSIAAIMRLRKGHFSREIEESRAIFITMNSALFRIARDFVKRETRQAEGVPPAITDKVLTNLLWLKQPLSAPDLPRKRIIADCFAAVQPSNRLWEAYIQEVENLSQRKDITADDYYLLKYSPEAKMALMDVTSGDETAFVQGHISEILHLAKERIKGELKDDLRMAQQEKEAIEAQLNYERRIREVEIAAQKQRIHRIAELTAKYTSKGIGLFVATFLVITSVYSFWAIPLPKLPWARWLIGGGLFILFLYTIFDSLADISLFSLIKRLELWLMDKTEGILIALVNNNMERNLTPAVADRGYAARESGREKQSE